MPHLKKEDMNKLPKRNILEGGGGGKRKGKINEMGLEEEGF
jgi:hypothetical protein